MWKIIKINCFPPQVYQENFIKVPSSTPFYEAAIIPENHLISLLFSLSIFFYYRAAEILLGEMYFLTICENIKCHENKEKYINLASSFPTTEKAKLICEKSIKYVKKCKGVCVRCDFSIALIVTLQEKFLNTGNIFEQNNNGGNLLKCFMRVLWIHIKNYFSLHKILCSHQNNGSDLFIH